MKSSSKFSSSSSVVIFHPGSRHLYIGRGSDISPQRVLHLIARRRTSPSPEHLRRDTLVPILERKLSEKVPHEVESARLQLSLTLQSALKSREEGKAGADASPARIILTEISSVSSLNRSVKPSPVSNLDQSVSPPKQFRDDQFVVGDDVIDLSTDESFNIFCPWRRGQLNLNREVGGSITAVIKDLEDIWRWCLIQKLKIPEKDFPSYKAVIVISVMFDRLHAHHLMNMLLCHLGFHSAFLVQDHVCASFGVGVACATVVDVGDQKVSVSCVEDGVSYPQSRLELKYGGGDLTVALRNQFRLTSFPIPLNIGHQWDLEFLNQLKEKYCSLDMTSWKSGPRKEIILWNKPDQPPTQYTTYLGDELYLVPLSFFNPDLLRGSIGRKAVIWYGPQPSVSDDPFDKSYLADTAQIKKSNQKDDDGEDDTLEEGLQSRSKLAFEIPLGIDQAIAQSIDSCSLANDLKKRCYSCIIVVGGGFKTTGLDDWLKTRMSSIMSSKQLQKQDASNDPPQLPKIITSAKNAGDPSTTVWSGATILSSLETAKELWINQREWRKFGSKILREKSLFQY